MSSDAKKSSSNQSSLCHFTWERAQMLVFELKDLITGAVRSQKEDSKKESLSFKSSITVVTKNVERCVFLAEDPYLSFFSSSEWLKHFFLIIILVKIQLTLVLS